MKSAILGRLTATSLYCAVLLTALHGALHAQDSAAAPAGSGAPPTETVVTAERGGYGIAALVNHRADAGPFKRGVLLFAGHPGILRLREEDGRAIFELRGNFLVRSRRHWLDAETLVVLVDAPSDQWGSFSQGFRRMPRYGADVAALVNLLGERYGVRDWTAVGTSEGSVSAFHAAQMNPTLIRRVILTASVFSASRNGPGLSEVNWSELRQPLLLAHHVDDPCKFTSYRSAEEVAAKTSAPLLTVRGGEGSRGGACEPFTAHGFVGVEVPAIVAMQGWIKTGAAPAEVSAAR